MPDRSPDNPRSYPPRMEKEKSAITEEILSLTLEILYLLTGEDYIIVKKPGAQTPHNNRPLVIEGICRKFVGNVLLTPPDSMTPQEDNELKILDLTNKVIELLTREVPIRCQDVTVYFSMEEWEYIEGHKDLYDDLITENHQNIGLPDGPICSNEVLHNVTSDLMNEDDMASDSGTESLKTHNLRDVQKISSETLSEIQARYENGNVSDVDHTHYSSICIKEEPWDEDNLPNSNSYSTVQFPSIHIKEEPASYDVENLTDPNIYTPTDHVHHPYPQIVGEPVSCHEQNLTQPNIYTSTGPSRYPSYNMEEPFSRDRGNLTDPNVYRPTDHTQQDLLPHSMEEPTFFNNKDLNDSNLRTQYVPIRIKKEPVSREEHIETKKRRYPIRQSKSALVKPREPASRSGRKRKNFKNTGKEPPAASIVSGQPDDDNETNCSSSVYSVRESDNSMEILYHCPSCHKGFYSNLDLARHQVIHTVDKLFLCSLCGKSFTEMSFLIKHQVIHTDLKLCVCQVCGGCFYSETSLAKHQKSHSLPVYCSTCGKCFYDKTEMEIHKRKHTGERPFACHVCGKQFIVKSVLNKHMLTHIQAKQAK